MRRCEEDATAWRIGIVCVVAISIVAMLRSLGKSEGELGSEVFLGSGLAAVVVYLIA